MGGNGDSKSCFLIPSHTVKVLGRQYKYKDFQLHKDFCNSLTVKLSIKVASRLHFSLGNLRDSTVAPTSRYTPVVISTSTTSHLWKRKRGLVLVVCITTYQPGLVFALKAANQHMPAETAQHVRVVAERCNLAPAESQVSWHYRQTGSTQILTLLDSFKMRCTF